MSFNLNFDIIESKDCKIATLSDKTCSINRYNKYACVDGYDIPGNIKKSDISYTRFNWVLPDGSDFLSIDKMWVPDVKSSASFQVTGGTMGIILVDIDGVILGQTPFLSDLNLTISALIQNINSLASDTGWQCYLQDGSSDILIIQSINTGIQFNGRTLNVTVGGDISVNIIVDFTFGANGNTDCLDFTMEDLSEISSDCLNTEFPDGIHKVTYVLYDSNNNQIARLTKSFLFNCLIKNIIRNLILLPAEDKCSCSDKFDERLVELKLMLEKAEIEFKDCLFDSANKTILSAHKFAEGICLDC